MKRSCFTTAAALILGVLATNAASVAAAQGCPATNARLNLNRDLKSGTDYVPVVPDDSLGFHVVYSVKYDSSFTVGIFILPLSNGNALIFGAGYGENSLAGEVAEAASVDATLRTCLGRLPATSKLHFIAPHGHGDHINEVLINELRALGWDFEEIAFHDGDGQLVDLMDWTTQDRLSFRELRGNLCGDVLASYPSPMGTIWFTPRPGHTSGSIDLVLDIADDPTNRWKIRGSVAGGNCPPLPGMQLAIDAHGTVFLPPDATTERARAEVMNGSGINRLCLMTDVSPHLGSRWQAEVNPTGHAGATALVMLAYGAGLDTGIQVAAGEFLLDTLSSPYLFHMVQPATQPNFFVDVPSDTSYLGFEGWAQGIVLGGGMELCNALHIKLGM